MFSFSHPLCPLRCRVYLAMRPYPAPFLPSPSFCPFIPLQRQNPRVAQKRGALPSEKGKNPKPNTFIRSLCAAQFLNFGHFSIFSVTRGFCLRSAPWWGLFLSLKSTGPEAEPFRGQSAEKMAIWLHPAAVTHHRQNGTGSDGDHAPPKPPQTTFSP